MYELEKIEEQFEQKLLSVDILSAWNIITHSVEEIGKSEARERIIIPVIKNMNKKWIDGKLTTSQIYMSSLICEEIFYNKLKIESCFRTDLNVAIASFEEINPVKGRIIKLLIQGFGIRTEDYGDMLNVKKLVKKIEINKTRVVLIYAPTTYSICKIKELNKLLSKYNLNTKIIVQVISLAADNGLCEWKGIYAVKSDIIDVIKSLREVEMSCKS